jgi:hypothetical protein
MPLGQTIEHAFTRQSVSMTAEGRISAFNTNMTRLGILSDNPIAFQEQHAKFAEMQGWPSTPYTWPIANYEAGDVVFFINRAPSTRVVRMKTKRERSDCAQTCDFMIRSRLRTGALTTMDERLDSR